MAKFELIPNYFEHANTYADTKYYRTPCMAPFMDKRARGALTTFLSGELPRGGDMLDLMSGRYSHYPRNLAPQSVTGLNMNLVELEANPWLTARIVHDLYREPRLPFADASFDGCSVNLAVEYLTQPVAVLAEVARVLKSGAPFIISYSNRYFMAKAIALWRLLDDLGRGELVRHFLNMNGGFEFEGAQVVDLSPAAGLAQPLFAVTARKQPRLPLDRTWGFSRAPSAEIYAPMGSVPLCSRASQTPPDGHAVCSSGW